MKSMSNTRKIVISVLAALLMAVAGVVLSGGLHTGTKAAAVTTDNKKTVDLSGEYHQVQNGIPSTKMSATIIDDTILITLTADSGEEGDSDAAGTYWVGTFGTDHLPTIVSKADKKTLDSSLFGSRDTTKTFTYEDGDITFPFQMMGMSTTVRLSK